MNKYARAKAEALSRRLSALQVISHLFNNQHIVDFFSPTVAENRYLSLPHPTQPNIIRSDNSAQSYEGYQNVVLDFLIEKSLSSQWKWKWSNGVRKSEISIIWCISITNNSNVKSRNKFTNSSNGRLRWFPTDFLDHTVELGQNYANTNKFFSSK